MELIQSASEQEQKQMAGEEEEETQKRVAVRSGSEKPVALPETPLSTAMPAHPAGQLSRGRIFLLSILLIIVILNATVAGFGSFFGPQGWGSVFTNGPSGQNLISQARQQLHLRTPTPGTSAQNTTAPPTPLDVVNALLSQMTLNQKLGQMMMVQFTGPDYSPDLSAMISQYDIGSVLLFTVNDNIISKTQVKSLIAEMQKNADLPLAVSIDQEGGTVDRLAALDGPQPSAASIGATGNPDVAYQQGLKDAQNLAYYGFNLNLAPVVDVTNIYNAQLYDRTFGNNPTIVTKMAAAYLKGLQKSGKVLGTLKHFPGLGDVGVDPHTGLPDLTRSLDQLNAIDWAPYRQLISQGNVYSVLVTHEIVQALDPNEPSSLSPPVINILRNQMHFQGVIITDSLTMQSITDFYTPGEAAAKAIEAGNDIILGAQSPNDVAAMIDGIKEAISSGAISEQRIDDSVRRILLLKYKMGLLNLNQ